MTKKQSAKKKNTKKNPYVKMISLGALCVIGIGILAFYVCAKMMGDSIYYTLYRRYEKSAAYEDTAHDIILHSRTHKPFTGVIVLEDHLSSGQNARTDGVDIQEHNKSAHDGDEQAQTPQVANMNTAGAQAGGTQKEVFIKRGVIRGEKVYNTKTGKLCQETFFDYDGHFKYRRSYGTDCSYLEKEEIFKKDANVVLFYNAKGQKTVKAFIENDRFVYGFCYERFGQTIPLSKRQLERLNAWDTSVTCRE